jgi:surface protein
MFFGANSFNEDIGNWDVSNVIDMSHMFYVASLFNQPIGNWDVSNVTQMDQMFYFAQDFNQDISNWDVSKVHNFKGMFQNADDFDKPLTNWDIVSTNSLTMEDFMLNKTFNNYSATNYDILLSRCEQGGLSNVTLDMGTIKYTIGGQARKNNLVNNFGWTISDGGLI